MKFIDIKIFSIKRSHSHLKELMEKSMLSLQTQANKQVSLCFTRTVKLRVAIVNLTDWKC